MKNLFVIIFIMIIWYTLNQFSEGKEFNMEYNKLSSKEEYIIINKGTEKPFSGKFLKHDKKGTYICKRCNTPLYNSADKFESHCGWPSFDDEIPGAVKRQKDADGQRIEILCKNCNGHLGHVFSGENLTSKNTRHCVNSLSMKFIPAIPEKLNETVYFAGGCFWGTEYHFQKLKGVTSTNVGYTGGKTETPTYESVCSGLTEHAEVVEVIFDPEKVDYEKLVKLFFEIHDFTQIDRQGPDIGTQYRSEIFYTTENQKTLSNKIITQLIQKGYDVATQVTKAEKYWEGERYHQDYYDNKGTTPYCHIYKKLF
ncbi:bifunctional methionine sulfoxide reductase B/A protein [bacterium]|nr:bifunctional methionine sulfoxide reductase B/A protein [bacterium]